MNLRVDASRLSWNLDDAEMIIKTLQELAVRNLTAELNEKRDRRFVGRARQQSNEPVACFELNSERSTAGQIFDENGRVLAEISGHLGGINRNPPWGRYRHSSA
jgi:hypothetical protein